MAIAIIPRTFTKPCYFHSCMRYISLFVLLSLTASGQALRDINYSFQYNPNEPIEVRIEAVKSNEGWTAFYKLSLRDTTQDINQFLIQWDLRKDLSEKEGVVVELENISTQKEKYTIGGKINLHAVADLRYLTEIILNNTVIRDWIFIKIMYTSYTEHV